MLLSIIIPCYKVEKYIQKCLDSVYGQKINEDLFEVIIVNDGSPDKSMELAEPYTRMHSNCILINQENGGLSVARNTGYDASHGEYVWFVDSDDWLAEGAVGKILGLLNQDNSLDVITTPLLWSYTDTKLNHPDICINSDMTISGKQYFQMEFSTGAIQRNVIRRRILEKQIYVSILAFFTRMGCSGRRCSIKREKYLY